MLSDQFCDQPLVHEYYNSLLSSAEERTTVTEVQQSLAIENPHHRTMDRLMENQPTHTYLGGNL